MEALLKQGVAQLPLIQGLIRDRNELLEEVSNLRSELNVHGEKNPTLEWWRTHPFYSPLPDLDDVRARSAEIFAGEQTPLVEIDLQVEA